MSDIYKAPTADLTAGPAQDHTASIDKAVSGQFDFSVSGVLAEAWGKTKGNKGTIWVGFLMYLIVVIPISLVLEIFLDKGMFAEGLRFIVTNSVDVALAAGIWMLGVKLASGIKAESNEVYAYIEHFPKLLGAYLLMAALVVAGFFLLVLPGIYLAVAYSLASVLIVDKKLGIWAALEASRKALTHCWFRVFFLALIYAAIMIVSIVPLGIGLIWTLPMGVMIKGIVYREVFGYTPAAGEQ